jgi:hypothetical protein
MIQSQTMPSQVSGIPLSKVVFVGVVCVAYTAIVLAFLYMFNLGPI